MCSQPVMEAGPTAAYFWASEQGSGSCVQLLPVWAAEGGTVEAEGGLLERQDVTAAARDLVSGVAAGRAGALFVVGEAGLGKTAVLDRASRLAAAAGLAVGAGRGHPMETGLPFGLVAQALDGVGGHGLVGEDEP